MSHYESRDTEIQKQPVELCSDNHHLNHHHDEPRHLQSQDIPVNMVQPMDQWK